MCIRDRINTRSEVTGPHGPLFTRQRKMLSPMPNPVIALVGELGDVIDPLPLIKFHNPVAGKMSELPDITVKVSGRQRNWSGPALAMGLFASKRKMLT